MKQLFTSYFAKSGSHEKAINIASFGPNWFKGPSIKAFAPPGKLIGDYKKGLIGSDEYTVRYMEHIKSIHKEEFETLLDNIPDGSILLCYERIDLFCHRHLLAGFIENNFKNISIKELN